MESSPKAAANTGQKPLGMFIRIDCSVKVSITNGNKSSRGNSPYVRARSISGLNDPLNRSPWSSVTPSPSLPVLQPVSSLSSCSNQSNNSPTRPSSNMSLNSPSPNLSTPETHASNGSSSTGQHLHSSAMSRSIADIVQESDHQRRETFIPYPSPHRTIILSAQKEVKKKSVVSSTMLSSLSNIKLSDILADRDFTAAFACYLRIRYDYPPLLCQALLSWLITNFSQHSQHQQMFLERIYQNFIATQSDYSINIGHDLKQEWEKHYHGQPNREMTFLQLLSETCDNLERKTLFHHVHGFQLWFGKGGRVSQKLEALEPFDPFDTSNSCCKCVIL